MGRKKGKEREVVGRKRKRKGRREGKTLLKVVVDLRVAGRAGI